VASSLSWLALRVSELRLALLLDLKHGLDLDGDTQRQGAGPHSAADSDTVFGAKNVGQKLAGAVDHGGLLIEISRAVDHAEELHHATDPIERAECGFHRRQDADRSQLGRLVARLNFVVGTQLALEDLAIGRNR
jgi:hypothetical protein